ncbi:OsmC family protein [Hymenobacter sp. 15J16-1T3B]|uniref:OsmC family protein n=1 Tax=Hymenobacter sp. 15J16-1T3B TaxID=2886941 RepID=UPI001D129389|nr:OsmC family protein [Hymenobacter sp. 15J16-1T3B]MCC3157442.1 OsmC family protein [Hymenobacter sp. 15J16-1T3B]
MHIHARIHSSADHFETAVQTNATVQILPLPPKPTGQGGAVNGGELLLLALATCFCNDLYREAARRGLALKSVAVECSAEFGAEGQPGTGFCYRAQVEADAPAADLEELLAHTDRVAEVHNTLRQGVTVTRLP